MIFVAHQVELNVLGSAAGQRLMGALQPDYWFSAHLHVKHAALVSHPPGTQSPPPLSAGSLSWSVSRSLSLSLSLSLSFSLSLSLSLSLARSLSV